jgi:hypothetical protein
MGYSTVLGTLSVAIGILAYGIYIWQSSGRKGVQPHPFSWFLWGLVTAVAYLVQRVQGGGAGSWVTGFTAAVCLVIGSLTLVKHQWRFSWFDWFSIGAGLFVFTFYLFTKDPMHSAVLATVTDVVGYGPTVKKGWREPHKDSATSFALNGVKFVPALFALGSYSIATCLYPTTLVFVNGGVAVLLLVRRRQIAKKSDQIPAATQSQLTCKGSEGMPKSET